MIALLKKVLCFGHPQAAIFFGALSCIMLAPRVRGAAEDWPQFRGPNCSGVSVKGQPPVQISTSNSVLWTANVPWSPSSPCVSGDKVFLTTFADGQLQTCCYAANSGALLWTHQIQPTKLELFHNSEGSPAAATPAADGRHV